MPNYRGDWFLPFPHKGVIVIANKILPTGYENQVRVDIGVTTSILSDADIQSKATLAEALLIKSVPGYAGLIGDDLTFLQAACIAQVCALLCPGMAQRVKIAQQDETMYSFKIQATDWNKKKQEFEELIRNYVGLVAGQGDAIIHSPMGVVFNDRLQI